MEGASKPPHRARSDASRLTQALHSLSEQRHLILGAGVLMLVVAVCCGWRQFSTADTKSTDEPFAEMEGFDSDTATTLGDPIPPAPLIVPSTVDSRPVQDFGQAVTQWPGTAEALQPGVSSAHYTTGVEPLAMPAPATSPAWLEGTIETAEETAPNPLLTIPESALRYTRPASHTDAGPAR